MASRVNVKFVVILSLVLVLVAGGAAGLAVMVLLKTADDLAARGDAMMVEGDYKAAEVFYSKAVNKEPYNSEFLLKWREALHKWVPETDREFQTEFRSTYIPLHAQLALSDGMSHVDYQVEYVTLLAQTLEFGGFDRAAYEGLANECGKYIKTLEGSRPNDPAWIPLRRARGLAWSRIAAERLELTPEQLGIAEADLAASLGADPADFDALEALVTLKRTSAARAQELGRRTDADRLEKEALDLITAFVNTNGTTGLAGAQGLMLQTQASLRDARNAAVAQLGSAALPEIQRIAAEHQDATRTIAATLLQADPAKLDASVVRRLFSLERQTDSASRFDASLEVIARAMETRPEDPELVLVKADILAARREHQAAIDALEGLLSAPRPPLGSAGMLQILGKTLAAIDQTRYALLAAADAGADAAARESWVAAAKESRTRLIQMLPESSPSVQFFDAKIAMFSGDLVTAQQKLDQYNQVTNHVNPEGLWLAADVAQKLNQPGTAVTALERLLELDPTQAAAHVALATILHDLNRPEEAHEHYLVALEARPDDERLLEQIRMLEIRTGKRKADDPVEQALVEAQLLARGSESTIADVAGAIAMLRESLAQLGPNARLYAEIVRLLANSDNFAEAGEVAGEGLQHFPDDEVLQKYARAAASTGSVEDLVRFIEESDQPESQKLVAIYASYMRAGREEDAARTLAKAEQLAPNDPVLLEVLFSRAYQARDVARAKEIAERASAANADHVGGLSYRARVLMLEGQLADALAALNEAVQRNPNNASLWRLLAALQLELGRSLDAIQSFQRSLAIRPNDLLTVKDYCRSLVGLNRLEEALEVARRSEVYGRSNSEFMEMLLDLEARVGNKAGARDRREKILGVRPDDVRNRHGLADLYITLGQWDAARTLIEETRTKFGESDRLVELDARWYAERNQLENARRVYAASIANTPPADRLPKYVALAQFLLKRGHSSGAIVALEQAARMQPEGDHSVDARLGDTLMLYGREGDALRVYRRILEDGDDGEHRITKRAAEAALRIDRLTEAEQLLDSIPDGGSDVTVALLRAQIVLTRGDESKARSLLDTAVEKWPNDHRVWLKRAEAEALNEDLLPDALADIERALELRPDLPESHRKRAELLAAMGREAEAIEELKATVRLNPALEELRSALLIALIQRNMESEALNLASEWTTLHPQDVGLRSRIAEIFVQGGMPDAAVQIYREAVAIEMQPDMVLRLADLLLSADPPKLLEAERVLADAKTLVPGNAALLMARAKVFAQTDRLAAARSDCLASFRLTQHNADVMTLWYSALNRVFPDPQSLLSFLRELGAEPGAGEWAALFSARVLLEKAAPEQGFAQLQALIPQTRDPEARYAALRAISGHLYRGKQVEAALVAWGEALKLKPEDWQLENNIAYALASDLNRPAEALPYAEAAAKHGANNAETHDTLGTVYLALGRPADAIAPMEAAVRAARAPGDSIKYKTRLALARLESGDRQGAGDLVAEVQAWLDKGRELDDQYKAVLERVREGMQD
ncbi:MAG TPA: tetratricopeptide repeat protein [Phycisphaerales bacterium]|nr:tetratricopeptide repeat protein [Phycisphaerales bacterium]